MMGEVQKIISRAWMAWALLSVGQAQIGEEPVRKAERVEEEVRPATAVEEPVRRAQPAGTPKEQSSLGRLFTVQPAVRIESPQDGQVMPWETVDVFVQVENLSCEENGHRFHVILDNGSPIEHW
ncbi:MAG: hypothetical protein O2830_06460, partial [Verrucomicrobia bacterium]|nr:hypothetical protein [Verrucomicrobiota bacterium]